MSSNSGYVIWNKLRNWDMTGTIPLDINNVPTSTSGLPQAIIDNDGTTIPIQKDYNTQMCPLRQLRWIINNLFQEYCQLDQYGNNTGNLIRQEIEQKSDDGGISWQSTGNTRSLIEQNLTTCPITLPIYRWIDDINHPPFCETISSNTGYLITPEKEQRSLNNGITWTDTGQTRQIKKTYNITACPLPQVQYRWVLDPNNLPFCELLPNGDNTGMLITPEKQQKSLDNGNTWIDTGQTRQTTKVSDTITCPVTSYIFDANPQTFNISALAQDVNSNITSTRNGLIIPWQIVDPSALLWTNPVQLNSSLLKISCNQNCELDWIENVDGELIPRYGARSETIALYQNDTGEYETITVNQAAAIPTFTHNNSANISQEYTFQNIASQVIYAIDSSVGAGCNKLNWSIIQYPASWVTVSNTINNITLSISQNPNEVERITNYKIKQEKTNKIIDVVIRQQAKDIIVLDDFDYLVIRYTWTADSNGSSVNQDLDTATYFDSSGTSYDWNAGSPQALTVGFSQQKSIPTNVNVGANNIIENDYLYWGNDDQSQNGVEAILFNVQKFLADNPTASNIIRINLRGKWYVSKSSGITNVGIKTYKGGHMIDGPGFDITNVGGTLVLDTSFNTTVTAGIGSPINPNSTQLIGYVEYDRTTNSAILTKV